MTDTHRRRRRRPDVATLFEGACDRPTGARSAWLAAACGADATLLADVRELLAADRATSAALDRPPHPAGTTSGRVGAEPPSIPGYAIRDRIGAGGMGVVYRARQAQPVQRDVALKVLGAGLGVDFAERFAVERQILATLDHTGIARVFDAGTTRDGRPFCAMELVDGQPITTYCDDRRLSTTARVELFAAVCDAVQHAHERGVVHRDLKPSNVLVTEQDGRPLPKVIDFGIAKAPAAAAAATPATGDRLTLAGQLLGTPEYMSPEHGRDDLDARADVFSLGVVLFELLAGVLPFDRSRALRAWADAVDPDPSPAPRASNAASPTADAAHARATTPSTLASRLRGDLDAILATALATDRTRRYASARELADDLRRHLRDEPITARAPGTLHRLGCLLRRRRAAVVATAAVVAAAIVVTAVTLWSQHRGERDHVELLTASDELLEQATSHALVDLPGSSRIRRTLLESAERIATQLAERCPDDAESMRRVRRSRHEIGQLYLDHGQDVEAERALLAALGTAIGEPTPHDVLRRAAIEFDLFRVLRRQEREAEVLRRGRALDATLCALLATEPQWATLTATSRCAREIAITAHRLGDAETALDGALRSERLLDAGTEVPPRDRAWYLHCRADSGKLAGQMLAAHAPAVELRRVDALFAAATRAQRELLEVHEPTAKRRHQLTLTLDTWSWACGIRHDWQAALEHAQVAAQEADSLVAMFPERAPYATTWLLVRHKVVGALHKLGRTDEALAMGRTAIATGRELQRRHPDETGLEDRLSLVERIVRKLIAAAPAVPTRLEPRAVVRHDSTPPARFLLVGGTVVDGTPPGPPPALTPPRHPSNSADGLAVVDRDVAAGDVR